MTLDLELRMDKNVLMPFKKLQSGFIPVLGLVVVAFLTLSFAVVTRVTTDPNLSQDIRKIAAELIPDDGGGEPPPEEPPPNDSLPPEEPPPPEETPPPEEQPPNPCDLLCEEVECGSYAGCGCGGCGGGESCENNQCVPNAPNPTDPPDYCASLCAEVECGAYSGCVCGGCGANQSCNNNQCVNNEPSGPCKICINDFSCGNSGIANCSLAENECDVNSDCWEAGPTSPPTPEPTDPPNYCASLCNEVQCGSYLGCDCGGCGAYQSCQDNFCITNSQGPSPCRVCSGNSCTSTGIQGCNSTANECTSNNDCQSSATPTPAPGTTPPPLYCEFTSYSACAGIGCQNCSYCGDGSWECADVSSTPPPTTNPTPPPGGTPYPTTNPTPTPNYGYCGDGSCNVAESCGNCYDDCGLCYYTPPPSSTPAPGNTPGTSTSTPTAPTPTPDYTLVDYYNSQTTNQYSSTYSPLSYSYTPSYYTTPLLSTGKSSPTVSYDPLNPYDNTCQSGDPECLAIQRQGEIVIPLMMGGTLAAGAAPFLPAMGEAALYAYSFTEATLATAPGWVSTTLMTVGAMAEIGGTAAASYECWQGSPEACSSVVVGQQLYLASLAGDAAITQKNAFDDFAEYTRRLEAIASKKGVQTLFHDDLASAYGGGVSANLIKAENIAGFYNPSVNSVNYPTSSLRSFNEPRNLVTRAHETGHALRANTPGLVENINVYSKGLAPDNPEARRILRATVEEIGNITTYTLPQLESSTGSLARSAAFERGYFEYNTGKYYEALQNSFSPYKGDIIIPGQSSLSGNIITPAQIKQYQPEQRIYNPSQQFYSASLAPNQIDIPGMNYFVYDDVITLEMEYWKQFQGTKRNLLLP